MAAPVVQTADTTSNVTTGASVNSLTCNWPGNISAGDLLLAVAANDADVNNPGVWDTGDGWTNESPGAYSGASVVVAYKTASGSETGSTTYTMNSGTEQICLRIFRITGAESVSTQAPELLTPWEQSGTGLINILSLSPTGGSKDYLWFMMCSSGGIDTYTFPTNYTTNAITDSSSGGGDVTMGTSWRTNTAASEDPDAFGDANVRIATILAIHPAGGAPAAGINTIIIVPTGPALS